MKKAAMAVLAMVAASIAGGADAQQADVKLKEVVVTATKTEKDPKDVTQSVTVITAEEIKRSSAATIADVVNTASGIVVTDQGPRGSLQTLSVRGASYAQVLVLIDGVRINSPRDAGVDLSAIPVALDDIDRIEIVRGPASALYGADAVGGVVNIITKRPAAASSRISADAGSHGYDLLQANTSGKQGAANYSITGGRETSDGYRRNSDLEQWTVGGRIGYDLAKASSIDLSARYISKDNGVPGPLTFPSFLARQLERELVLGANYRQHITSTVDLRVSGSRTDDTLHYRDPDFLINSTHRTTSDAGEGQLSWLAGPWSLFSIGYEVRRNELNSTDAGRHEMVNRAYYLQDEISLGNSLIVVAGDRFDQHSVYGDKHSPRVSTRYLINGGTTIVRASYGESFRGPTFNDLYWKDPFSTGNPNLRPETAVEYEAGIDQKLGAAGNFSATWFDRRVRDLINWNYLIFPMMPENIGRADITGVETAAGYAAAGGTRLSANYTYMRIDAVDAITGAKVYTTLVPKNQFKGQIVFPVDANVFITLDGRSVENYVRPGDPKWRYSVYDAKIAQKLGKKADKGEIYFSMSNVFDRKYEAVRNYPMPPKEIRGGITLQF